MPDVTISARVPEALKGDLLTLATALKRTPSSLVEEAIRALLASEAQFLAAVRQGQADIATGQGVPWETVEAELDELIANTPAREP